MTINKLLDHIVCDFRRLELHLRFRDTEYCRNERGVSCSFWSFQKTLKNADRSFRSPLDELQSAPQHAAFSSFGDRRGLHLFEKTTRAGNIACFNVQFGRSQLRSRRPFLVMSKKRKFFQRFIASSQCPQHFRRPKRRRAAKRRPFVAGQLLVKWQRFGPPMQARESLGAPKFCPGQVTYPNILQQSQSVFRLFCGDLGFSKLFHGCAPLDFGQIVIQQGL